MTNSIETPPTCRRRRILFGVIPLLGLGLVLLFGYQHCGQLPDENAMTAPAGESVQAAGQADPSADSLDTRTATSRWPCPTGCFGLVCGSVTKCVKTGCDSPCGGSAQ